MELTITFEGRDWQYDSDKLDVLPAMAFHSVHGLTVRAWIEGIQETDPRAFQCAYWLMLQQNGVEKPLKDLNFDLLEFMTAYAEAIMAAAERQKELEAAKEPDPTQDSLLAMKTRKPPGSSTSPSAKSAASTSSSSPAPATSEPPL
jgi:hypothetical protein